MEKNISLYAYTIKTNSLTGNSNLLFNWLKKKLELKDDNIQNRRHKLNKDSLDEDLLSDYEIKEKYIFGTMMRIAPAETMGAIKDELLKQKKISISELDSENKKEGLKYKGIYYFAFNETHIVTNRPISLKNLSVYFNWLLEEYRKDTIFRFEKLVTSSPPIELMDIKSIELGSGLRIDTNQKESVPFGTMIEKISTSVLESFSKGNKKINDLLSKGLVEASLLLRIVSKPKNMTKDEYNNALSLSLSSSDDITIISKKNKKIKGEEFHAKRDISIEYTSNSLPSEDDLRLEMETFLNDIK